MSNCAGRSGLPAALWSLSCTALQPHPAQHQTYVTALPRAAYWAPLILRMGCRTVSGTGRELRDGLTAQRAAALGPVPA